MDTRIDCYGREITHTTENGKEVFSFSGIIVKFPLGTGWDDALGSIEKHAPSRFQEE